MANLSTWSKGVPSGASLQREFDDLYRSDKSVQEATWDTEHYFNSSSKTSAGVHRLGSARIYMGTRSQLSTPTDGNGRLFYASDTSSLHVLGASSATTLFAGEPLAKSGGSVFGLTSFYSAGNAHPVVHNPSNLTATVALSWASNIARIRIGGSGAGSANSFQIQGGSDSVRWGVDANGNGEYAGSVLTVGGNTVWHAGNDGAGSGLDADTVDGYDVISYASVIATTGVAGNGNTGFDWPVTGAAVGDAVYLGYQGDSGLVLQGRVTSANTVSVIIHNLFGSRQTLSNATFTVIVFHA